MRKYLKYLVAVILVLISVFMAKAQTSGYGCLVGNTVFTEYLGEDRPYGPNDPLTKYYKFNGNSVDINYNNYNSSNTNNYGYDCTKINIFGASGTGPAQQEYTSQNVSCVTSATLNSSIKGNGTYVYYSYKNPSYCGGTPLPLPLDDYNWVIILGFGAIGGFFIVKKRNSYWVDSFPKKSGFRCDQHWFNGSDNLSKAPYHLFSISYSPFSVLRLFLLRHINFPRCFYIKFNLIYASF